MTRDKDDRQWFEQVSREPRLADKVADLMRETIRSLDLRPGDRLPSERELGEQFGVSRTVIREAVRSLAGTGLLEVRQGSGLRVASADPAKVRESMEMYIRGSSVDYPNVHEVRAMLEVEIAVLAARRATKEDLEQLGAARTAIEEAVDDVEAASVGDVEFHRAIAMCAHNPLYIVLLDSIGDAQLAIRRENWATGSGPDTLAEHADIFDCIAARDEEGAAAAMRTHLESVASRWHARADGDSTTSHTDGPAN
jgi:GntR family transcriptional repressor for pyruvate dehydrogenase complex